MQNDVLVTIHTHKISSSVDTLDRDLKEQTELNESSADPDGYGLYDRTESFVGLGFVLLQTYLVIVTGRLGLDKKHAYSNGPFHTSGVSYANLVNDGANYWKHYHEWDHANLGKRENRIISTFNIVGINIKDPYPLANFLYEITKPSEMSYQPLFEKLKEWVVYVE